MKILLVGPLPPPLGGATVNFSLLIEELCKVEGCSVTVVNTSSPRVSLRTLDVFAKLLVRFLFDLPKNDVVGFHASTKTFILVGPILVFLCFLFRKPLVGRIFGGSIRSAYEEGGILKRWMIRRAFSMAAILVQAKELKTYFEERIPRGNYYWFPNSRPLDPKVKARRHAGRPFRFLFASHVQENKGVNLICDSAGLLKDLNYTVRFFGRLSNSEIRNKIVGTPRHHYEGEIEPRGVLKELDKSDVLLLPSFYDGEGYPGIITEAFSRGVPVISSDWAFIPELVKDGFNGKLVRPRDIEDLAYAMRLMMEDQELYAKVSAGALATASSFSSERWYGQGYYGICRAVNI